MNKRIRTLFSCLLLLCSVSVVAQEELKVKSFKLEPNRVLPTADRRLDLDKDPCALIIVQVNDEIERVEGNIMLSEDKNVPDIPRKGKEQWVYLTDGTKDFRLIFKNHYSLQIKFSDYGIKQVEGNRVYLLTLSDDKVQVQITDVPAATGGDATTVPTQPSTTTITITNLRHSDDKAVEFGLRAGLNMATTQFDSQYDGTSMTTGFHVGLGVDLRLSSQFYFTTGLLYSSKGYKYDDGNVAESAKAQYIDVPLLASWRLPLGDALALQLSAGPYVAIGLGGSIKDDKASKYDQSFFDRNNSFDYGVQAGASLIVSHHFTVGAAYQIGMASYRNRNIMVSVGYNF